MNHCRKDRSGYKHERCVVRFVREYVEALKNNHCCVHLVGHGTSLTSVFEELGLRRSEHPMLAYEYACFLLKGAGDDGGAEDALCIMKDLANRHFVPAIHMLGRFYEIGIVVEKDEERALSYYETALRAGYAPSHYRYARIKHLRRKHDEEYGKIIGYYTYAAEMGMAKAQFDLGDCYMMGSGVERSPETAAIWYEKAAKQGSAEAQRTMGVLYYKGEGVKQSYKRSLYWTQKAADKGDADALCNLGIHYEEGFAVEKSPAKAVAYMQKAAALGDIEAVWQLAWYYEIGFGVERSIQRALECYERVMQRIDVSEKIAELKATRCKACGNYDAKQEAGEQCVCRFCGAPFKE